MAHHHTLGLAGRTGGVDHIRQVLVDQLDIGIITAVVGVLVLTHKQHLLICRQGQTLMQVTSGQQHMCTAVFEHKRQSIGRKLRVQRYIGTSRLERRQQGQHHVHRTVQGDSHQAVRADTCCAQTMGQAIGALVQFCIAQRLTIAYQRRRLRTGKRLCFQQAMHAHILRRCLIRLVPVAHQLLPLRIV